jgi:dephospho-CoA kinase
MIKVAITGNIASGKSQVEKILLSLKYKVADTDKINHFILLTDMSAIKEIKETFSKEDILDEDGCISRAKLGKIVFSDDSKKLQLEDILHKRIIAKVQSFFNENANEKVVFVAIPLLFETHREKDFDKIIFVSADKDVRLKRLMARDNYSEKYARIRIDAQADEKEKIEKSDFVIYNNSDYINLRKQIRDILAQLIDKK